MHFSFKEIALVLTISLIAFCPVWADDSQAASTQAKKQSSANSQAVKPASTKAQAKPNATPAQSKPAPGKKYVLQNKPEKPSTMRFHLNGPLEGGVSVNVPHTPEQVTTYLKTMKGIIHEYEAIVTSSLLGDNGIKMDPSSLGDAQNQTLSMIERIRSIVPPYELKNKHNELANTLAAVSPYIENPFQAGTGIGALTQIAPVLSRLHNTLERYHSGVRNCLAYYNLSPELDPFWGESEDVKDKLNTALNQTKNSLINRGSANEGVSQGSDLGVDSSSVNDMLNSLGGGGSLGNMNGLQGLQGLDLNSLMKQLNHGGAMPQAGASDDANGQNESDSSSQSGQQDSELGNVNQIFEQMQNH